jgi:hypothetical protein
MKTTFHICLIALISFATVSCSKSEMGQNPTATFAPAKAEVSASIHRFIMEPSPMEIGTVASTIDYGSDVTLFVPYTLVNEQVVSAKISMIDDATGQMIKSYNLVHSSNETALLLSLPANLLDFNQDYYFIRFNAGDDFNGKTVTLQTEIKGQVSKVKDAVTGAFTVLQ